MAYISDSELLNLENVRVVLRNNLRKQGIVCADDEPIESLANKVTKIQSYTAYLDKTLSGKIYSNELTSSPTNMFNGFGYITEAYFPEMTGVGQSMLMNCGNLEKVNIPKATSTSSYAISGGKVKEISLASVKSIGNNGISCSALEILNIPRYEGTSCYTSSTKLRVVDLGSAQTSGGFNPKNSTYFTKLILRRTTEITTLSDATTFNGTPFATSGGRLFVPASLITNYENGTNWASLSGMTVVNLIGSRFEDVDWYENYNSHCTLDGNEIRILDNETVAIFKYTEGISHVYENGVELQDNVQITGKTLTTTV